MPLCSQHFRQPLLNITNMLFTSGLSMFTIYSIIMPLKYNIFERIMEKKIPNIFKTIQNLTLNFLIVFNVI